MTLDTEMKRSIGWILRIFGFMVIIIGIFLVMTKPELPASVLLIPAIGMACVLVGDVIVSTNPIKRIESEIEEPKTIWNMKLHDTLYVEPYMITKVPGGWLYKLDSNGHVIFVKSY